MKIGFLKHGSSFSASTRIRVDYVLPYLDNAIASNITMDLTECDAVIFQKRYKHDDILFANWLKENNKIIILDLTDPVWDQNYPGVYFPITNDTQEDFEYMLCRSDCIIFCTDRLREMFEKSYVNFNTKVIIDRIDLAKHNYDAIHSEKTLYNILWHGTKFNIPYLNLIREDLERLYKEVNFKLTIVHELGGKQLDTFNFLSIYKIWNLATINNEILNADITINPHPPNSYKSNNKTVLSMALGVPCVEDNFYENCKKLLTDTYYRTVCSALGKEIVKNKYDSKLSAEEIWEVVYDIGIQRNK